jgi:2,3-dihydro-2,3-dihydroxybenzoate dehydrogenase
MSGGAALVTGAAGGIGAEVARGLASNGAAVALLDRDGAALWARTEELSAAGHRVAAVVADVTSSSEVEAAVARVESELGPLGFLVNVAGVLRVGAVCELSDEDWDTTFAVNTAGVFYVCRAVARRMVPRRSGAIVTVASNAAGTARMGMSAYGASKAASNAFTKCLGLELAQHHIRCNVVAPGSTDTPMLTSLWNDGGAKRASIEGVADAFRVGIPLGKLAQPADVAAAVMFLLSDQASHITMHELTVDGGATLGV